MTGAAGRDEMLENGMVVGAQTAYEAQCFGPSGRQDAIEEARARMLKSMGVCDILGAMDGDDLVTLVHAGNANAIGRYVLAQVSEWATRVAIYEVDTA